jgi:L-ascorbate metabolism protein UlaG (beta-lactamase superfamily)
MRLGRPDLSRYHQLFEMYQAGEGAPLGVTFLGVSTLLLDDGRSAILVDGFFSRPPLARVALGRIAPDTARIDACLDRLLVARGLTVAAVLPVHSHYDHALDSAYVAERTGALLVGGESTANLGRGHELPSERIVVVDAGEPLRLGAFTVTLVESHHCPPDRYPGEITEPVRPPARAGAYRCGEAWSILAAHDTGRTALVQGSAGYVAGALAGHRADVAFLGVGQLGIQPEEYIEAYWTETVRAVDARCAVLTHWDDFFRPLPMTPGDPPLRALPYAGDDLDATMRVLSRLAEHDGVELRLPTVWQRQDPWR